ncbi:MAG: HDOD domain-containing protein [Desulfomonilia bacterium]|nr:HDOD domain-containing protein [Desulfomonilia bacterium]
MQTTPHPLKLLEIELQKIIALEGRLSIIVVPREYAEKALQSKRDVDTAVTFREYLIIGVFGLDADEASSMFLAVPKGMAWYPRDGNTIEGLFFSAMERLRNSSSTTPWVTQLWDCIKDVTISHDDAESRFLSSSFYQFYAFVADHPKEVVRMIHELAESDKHWIKEFLPFGTLAMNTEEDPSDAQDFSKDMEQWEYRRRLMEKEELGKKTLRSVRNVEHLFTLPSISKEIIDLAADPLLSASRMATIIEKDPVLTSRLLKVVNSAFYGFRRQIDAVEHAIVILGNEEVVNLAFSIAVHKLLGKSETVKSTMLWEHSLMVAHLTAWLGSIVGSVSGNMLYTVGLLHDFGKIIFLQRGYCDHDRGEVSSLKELAAEEETTGLSHAEMGAYVAERWNLPEGIVDGLMCHHLPAKARDFSAAVSVHAADIISHTGTLDLSSMNWSAAEVFRTGKGSSIPREALENKYSEIVAKVRVLLDVT